MHIRTVLSFSLFAAVFCCVTQAAVVKVPAGGRIDIGADKVDPLNSTATVLDLGEGATLAVTNVVGGTGMNRLTANVVATNGVAFLDLSAVSGGDMRLTGGLLCGSTGGLTVKGRGKLLFGQAGSIVDVNYPLFDAPALSFEMVDEGLVFTNCATLRAAPASYTVARGTLLALRGANTLADSPAWDASAGSHGTLTLSDFDVLILEEGAIPSGAIVRVGSGHTLGAKPCVVSPSSVFEWAGCRDTNRLDLVLEEGGTFNVLSLNDYVLEGSVSGAGRIIKHRGMGSGSTAGTAGAVIKGSLAGFTGAVAVAGETGYKDTLLRFSDYGANVRLDNVNFVSSHAQVRFEGPDDLTIGTVTATSDGDSNVLATGSGVTVTIGELSGNVTLAGEGRIVVSAMAEEAVAGILAGVQTGFGTFGFGASIRAIPQSGVDSVVLEGVTAIPYIAADEPVTVTLPDGCAVGGASANVTLRIGTGTSVSGSMFASGSVDLRGGSIRIDTSFSELASSGVLLWLDASQASSFQSLTNQGAAVTHNGHRLVDEWHDCRALQTTVYARNDRANLPADPKVYPRLYPYIVQGGLNGLDYLSCGCLGQQVADGLEYRRLYVWKNGEQSSLPKARFVIMVFGSKNGGGSGILGDKTGAFRRRAAIQYPIIRPDAPATGKPVPAARYNDMWIDGVKKVPCETLFGHDWQVISLDLGADADVHSFGQADATDTNTSGGQCYAEILLLAEVPTEAQRVAVERYLAKKWGLMAQYSDSGARTGARLSGTGTATLDADTELSGTFRGTVDVNGKNLVVSALPKPPAAADVPAGDRTFWVDPELDGAIDHGRTAATETRPLEVSALYGRDNAGLVKTDGSFYFSGPLSDDGKGWAQTTLDRRPWLSRGARGSGPVRNWLDFTDHYSPDELRNVLRVKTLPFNGESKTGDDATVPYRSGFFVLDSSRGGGSLVLDNIQGNGSVYHRDDANAAAPIWHSRNSSDGLYLSNGDTYLDGVPVDGKTHGFFGRPEVFSFTATQGLSTKFYTGHINAAVNCELVGEVILYNRALSDAERVTVNAYLMSKWLGIAPVGYSDLSGATLTGAGTVECASQAALPKFGDGFSGTITLAETEFAFAVDAQATPSVIGAISAPGATVDLPAAVTVRVDFPTKAKGGRYPLISAARLTGGTIWTLVTSGFTRDLEMRLEVVDGSLVLEVVPRGMVLIVD